MTPIRETLEKTEGPALNAFWTDVNETNVERLISISACDSPRMISVRIKAGEVYVTIFEDKGMDDDGNLKLELIRHEKLFPQGTAMCTCNVMRDKKFIGHPEE